ncbi:MAG: type II toxin-antitoxin system HicB family antitoxin [Proteobacteria bacterium]|nr:type II toxin-antitoxin system HicB family antitoxin [Pseudomonadota bacterium]
MAIKVESTVEYADSESCIELGGPALSTENGTVFDVVLKKLDDGRWHAWCPVLKGCHTWGHTKAEAMLYIQDAVSLYIEDLIACGEPIPGVSGTFAGNVAELKPIIKEKVA